MSNFLGDLLVKYIDGTRWEVAETFTYRIGHPQGDEFVHIGRGLITDFASIPRPVQLLWRSPGGKWDKPAVVHDCLYQCGSVDSLSGERRVIDRAEADTIFRQAMDDAGVNWFTRRSIWLGVRVGGWVPWNTYRKAEADARTAA